MEWQGHSYTLTLVLWGPSDCFNTNNSFRLLFHLSPLLPPLHNQLFHFSSLTLNWFRFLPSLLPGFPSVWCSSPLLAVSQAGVGQEINNVCEVLAVFGFLTKPAHLSPAVWLLGLSRKGEWWGKTLIYFGFLDGYNFAKYTCKDFCF